MLGKRKGWYIRGMNGMGDELLTDDVLQLGCCHSYLKPIEVEVCMWPSLQRKGHKAKVFCFSSLS